MKRTWIPVTASLFWRGAGNGEKGGAVMDAETFRGRGETSGDHQARIEWAKAYPFDVPDRSYIYHDGKAYFLRRFSLEDWARARVDQGGRDVALAQVLGPEAMRALAGRRRRAVIACGSNAAPRRLAQKFSRAAAPLPTIAVTVSGYAIVYAAKFAAYGSIPATLMPCPGARVRTFVNLLDEDQLAVMDETETLGVAYDRPLLRAARVVAEDGTTLDEVYAYISRAGVLEVDGAAVALHGVACDGVPFAARSQEAVQALVKDLLGVEDSLDRFIHENILTPAIRQARTARLQRHWSRRLDGPARAEKKGTDSDEYRDQR